jgi:hypothetical protein
MESLEGRLERRRGAGVPAGGGRAPVGRGSASLEVEVEPSADRRRDGESWIRCVAGRRAGAGEAAVRTREVEAVGVDLLVDAATRNMESSED